MSKLKLKKGAPPKLPFHWTSYPYKDETTCISPTLWYGAQHSKFRCNKTGSIPTDQGVLCVMHAKVYARRGWINIPALQKILLVRAEEISTRAKARARCLRKGACI